MERLENYLNQINSSYPLNVFSSALCISLANSGRRGNAKEFHITIESFITSLENIKEHLDAFSAIYDETTWRNASDNFFVDNHAKSLCGVQTRPYFETVNKFVSWANELQYVEGQINLTEDTLEKTLFEINNQCLKKILHYPLFDEAMLIGLNDNQIVNMLAAKLQDERQNSWGTQYFGFKYAQYLDSHTNIIPNILRTAGVDASLSTEISKGRGIFNRAVEDGSFVKWYWQNNVIQSVNIQENIEATNEIEENSDLSSQNFTPTQKIYYGVPGCGKSHTITTMLKDEKVKDPTFSEENQVVRTTFHPEYTNADFIGQILPEVHEDSQGKSVVEYKFKPGPFAKILKQALHNPSRPFYLVIEEINRGNAAAIFGDVFQLLDRLKNGDTSKEPVGTDGFENHYGKGWSEYFVMNADVNAYIRDAKSDDELDTKSIDLSGIHFSSSTGLRLPPNLSIYATMNTSDQNVFTLDNAFQRRWDMELVPNTCKWDDEDHKHQAQLPIGDTDIRWETFRKAINGEISDGDFFNADDKQLGLFFIEAEGDKIDGKKFANKVLKYLWTDVFKRDTGKIFKSENLSDVVENFTGTDAFDKVFVEDFAQSLKNANDEIKNHE